MAPTPRRSSAIAGPSSATTNRSGGGLGRGLGKQGQGGRIGIGGKGLGKSIGRTKRHRKVMKDTVHGISRFSTSLFGLYSLEC